jgi:hypothetical protein
MLRFVVFIALFAMVVYAGFWLLDRRKGGGGRKAAKPIPRGPVGPDDDEDFLRELERRRRHSKDGQTNGQNGQSQNGQSQNGKPRDVQPKKTPPPKAAPDQHPQDPKAKDPQPKPQPKDAKPNDGEA